MQCVDMSEMSCQYDTGCTLCKRCTLRFRFAFRYSIILFVCFSVRDTKLGIQNFKLLIIIK